MIQALDRSERHAVRVNGGNVFVILAQAKSGVEVLRVAQSFDPCIACAVH